MDKLRLGKVTGRELAKWFKVDYEDSYAKRPGSYLKKLEEYCEFERFRGYVVISEIYCYYYYKNITLEDRKFVLSEVKKRIKTNDGLASMSGITEKALEENKSFKDLTWDQAYYRVKKICLNLFGKTKKSGEVFQDQGTVGNRKYEWAVKLDGINLYRRFTSEEREAFLGLVEQRGQKTAEQLLFEKENLDEIKEKLKRGESIDENIENLEKSLYWFTDILHIMNDTFQINVVRATKHQVFEIIED